jgi:hypothetical protein
MLSKALKNGFSAVQPENANVSVSADCNFSNGLCAWSAIDFSTSEAVVAANKKYRHAKDNNWIKNSGYVMEKAGERTRPDGES